MTHSESQHGSEPFRGPDAGPSAGAGRDAPGEPLPAERRPRAGLLRILTAALVLVGGLALVTWLGKGDASYTEGRLFAAARSLAIADPELFEDFRPRGLADLEIRSAARESGHLTPLSPLGRIETSQPDFTWRDANPGTAAWTLSVRGAGGEAVFETRSSTNYVRWPAGRAQLPPGDYQWEVSAAGESDARAVRGFEVADEEARARLARALEEIGRAAPDDLMPLVRAQVALDGGYLLRALHDVREFLAAHPDDALGQATLEHLRVRLGLPKEGGDRRQDGAR